MRELQAYLWRGNIREPAKCGRTRDAACGEGNASRRGFSGPPWRSPSGRPGGASARGHRSEQLERSLVMQALERTGWNQTRAAALLGLNRDQIRYRIEKFNLAKSGAS